MPRDERRSPETSVSAVLLCSFRGCNLRNGQEQIHLFLPCDLWVLVSPSSLSHGFSLSLHVSGKCTSVRLQWEHSSNRACPRTSSTLPGDVHNVRCATLLFDSTSLLMTLMFLYVAWTDMWHVASSSAHSHWCPYLYFPLCEEAGNRWGSFFTWSRFSLCTNG